MPTISRIWFATLTKTVNDAGTDNKIVLIVNEDGVDKLHHTFPDTSQSDLEYGGANLYVVDVEDKDIDTNKLTNSSIRIAIRGDDMWCPRHVLIWGDDASHSVVFPLALEYHIKTPLSIGSDDLGPFGEASTTSMPVNLIDTLGADVFLRQIHVVLTTAKGGGAGTVNDVELGITFTGHGEWTERFKVPKEKEADFLFLSSFVFLRPPGPTRNILESVVLRLTGNDAWSPSSFFLFAYGEVGLHGSESPRPRAIIPLVHIPSWEFGPMSKDVGSVTLPLALVPS